MIKRLIKLIHDSILKQSAKYAAYYLMHYYPNPVERTEAYQAFKSLLSSYIKSNNA